MYCTVCKFQGKITLVPGFPRAGTWPSSPQSLGQPPQSLGRGAEGVGMGLGGWGGMVGVCGVGMGLGGGRREGPNVLGF